MNTHNQQQADFAGMQEAAHRHGAMFPAQIEQQYREIQSRPVGHVEPYREPSQDVEPLIPRRLARQMVVLSWGSASIGLGVGVAQVVASGAFNVLIGWIVGGGAVVGVLSSIFGNRSGNSSSSKKEYHEHHHYHQNNNFGNGGANQTNGK